jgi:hypothetical protein
MDDDTLTDAILARLDARAPEATICPSEVARAVAPEGWRALMPRIRAVARALARAGLIEIRQRGRPIEPTSGEWRGPVRLARAVTGVVPIRR